MSSWHRLVPSSGDDHTCTQVGCGVIVADEALTFLAIDCPVAPCEESSDGVCIFVGVEGDDGDVVHVECSYCGARGDLAEEDVEDDGDDPDEV